MYKFSLVLLTLSISAFAVETSPNSIRQVSSIDLQGYFDKIDKGTEWKEKKAYLNFCFKTEGNDGQTNFSLNGAMSFDPSVKSGCYSMEVINVRDESNGYYTFVQDPFKFLGQSSKVVSTKAYFLTDNLGWYVMFAGEWSSSISASVSSHVYTLNPSLEKGGKFKFYPDLACSGFSYHAPDGDCFECDLQAHKGNKTYEAKTDPLPKLDEINPGMVGWTKNNKNCTITLKKK